MRSRLLYIILFCFTATLGAQTDSILVRPEVKLVVKDAVKKEEYNPLAPQKAAFYSAVLPGLGQAYNKKYWKIPVIYAGIGTGIYFHIQNANDYNRFRDAYKRRLAGFTDDEFFGTGTEAAISDDRLIDAQRTAQRNKDVSIIVALAFYLINIVDANVDAHLSQYNVSDDISVMPKLNLNPINNQTNYGLSFRYKL